MPFPGWLFWASWEGSVDNYGVWTWNWPIFFISQYKYLQSCEKRMCSESLPSPVSMMRQSCKVCSTEKGFYLFSKSALLRWNGLLGGSRPVVGRDLTREPSEKDSSIFLALLTVFHWAEKLASVFFAFSASIGCQELLPCWVGLSDEWKTKGAQKSC